VIHNEQKSENKENLYSAVRSEDDLIAIKITAEPLLQ